MADDPHAVAAVRDPVERPAGDARNQPADRLAQRRVRHTARGSITVYRASVTNEAAAIGWTIDALCDEAFGHAGLTLASCPRAALQPPPARDPFKRSAAWLGNTH